MGLGDLWNRTLVYFGIAEDEEWDEDGYVTNEQLEESYRRRDRHNVRRLPNAPEADDWVAEEPAPASASRRQSSSRLRSIDVPGPAKVHLVVPRSFNEDRKSTRLNSSHQKISYAVFCLK